MGIKVITLNHESADAHVRSNFVIDKASRQNFLRLLSSKYGIRGCMVLNTCNRTDLYFQSDNISTDEVLKTFLKYLGIDSWDYYDYFFRIEKTLSASKYILGVASGLNSLTNGDRQIFSQFRESYKESLSVGMQGTILERLFQSSVHLHKQIINETGYLSSSESISYLSVKGAITHDPSIVENNAPVLVIGAGQMAKETIPYLLKAGFRNLKIVNRSPEKAEKLATIYGMKADSWDNLANAINSSKLIISCVSNCDGLLCRKELPLLQGRILIDLSIPLSIDQDMGDNNFLINLDTVKKIVDQNRETKAKSESTVRNMLSSHLYTYLTWLDKYKSRHTVQHDLAAIA